MNFVGKARKLDDQDLPRIAYPYGLGEDEIHAIIDVETRGGGFDRLGRPKMLFEPHVFYRELEGEKRAKAVSQGLAYRRWGERSYPRDSYPVLLRALKIDERAALRSASWGLGQIMGFNAGLAGYSSAKEMVLDFLDDEEKHLRAMMSFIANSNLIDELQRHDWAGFAQGYNGPGYHKHGYHTKLAQRFAWWQRKPDTPLAIDRCSADPNTPLEGIAA